MKNVEISGMDHYGRGIAKVADKVTFIDNALPNEIVDIEITNKKSKFNEGRVINFVSKSSNRIDPICPYYDKCGGCNIMHLDYNEQLKFKENKVKEVLKKFANVDCVMPIISNNQYFYRNKVTLQVKQTIGYYKNKSYDLIPIEKCYIADDRINNIIVKLKNINLENINQIVIRQTSSESMLVFYSSKEVNIDISKFDNIDTIIQINKQQKIIKGRGYIIEKINDINFVISPTSFFQVNTCGMIKLYNQVLKYCNLNGENLLDLYCGTGTIGIYLSKYCGKILGIELNKEAIKDAFKNKEINKVNNIDFKSGDVKEVLKDNKFKPDIIVVDPPRAGLDSLVIKQLLELKPKKIIYVSCDVVTLARDLKLLSQKYNIEECTPVDMFPNTYHVECVCLLKIH